MCSKKNLIMSFINTCLISVTMYAFVSCTSVDSINRNSLQLIPQETLVELSNKEFDKLKRNSKLSDNAKYLAQIERVVSRLSPFIPIPTMLAVVP